MPRIRTIKPEFWSDEKLAPMRPIDRLVFLGLISMADDAGRLLDNIKVIDAFIFGFTDDTAHESLMRLSRIGRIRRGTTASGQKVIEIVHWTRHQKVQHPQLSAALPEIVEAQVDGEVHEPFMNGSGTPHEEFTPHTNDQRPTTNDQRPTTTARAGRAGARLPRASRSASPSPGEEGARAGRDTWLTPAQGAWEKHFGPGSFRVQKAAGLLAPLRSAGLSPEEIGARLDAYCAGRKGRFCNLADFAEHHAEWARAPAERPGLIDGWMSPELEAETRPKGVA